MKSLEARLEIVEDQLGVAEKQAASLVNALKRLRKAAEEGAMVSLVGGSDQARADLSRIGEPLAQAAEAVAGYDAGDAFASSADLVLVQRDGRVTAYRACSPPCWPTQRSLPAIRGGP